MALAALAGEATSRASAVIGFGSDEAKQCEGMTKRMS